MMLQQRIASVARNLFGRQVFLLSTAPVVMESHKKKHFGTEMHPQFYENEFEATSIEELQFVRSPFYELAALRHLKEGAESNQLLADLSQKIAMTDVTSNFVKAPAPNKENRAFTRYADKVQDPNFEFQFQFPRGQSLQRINPAELFKVQKPAEHWTNVRRSKLFVADKFIPPFETLKNENLRAVFAKGGSETEICERLVEVIPHLNHDQIVHLALHLAFEHKINDRQVWRALEDAALASLHLMDLTQVCQLEWAST